MPPRERLGRVAMDRVALVAPIESQRALLVEVADAGTVELDAFAGAGARTATNATRREPLPPGAQPQIRRIPFDSTPSGAGRAAFLAGEDELDRQAATALQHERVTALLGWMPHVAVEELSARIAPFGGVVITLPRPPGAEPPTLLAPRGARAPFRVLVDTYGTVHYADVDPTPFAAVAFVVMFGMMFGDVGHGLVLIVLGLVARTGRGFLGRFRAAWAFAVAAGVVAMGFGFAYGEFFGPTGVVPTLWLDPLDDPVRLLVAGLAVGAVLVLVSQCIATTNRWREGGFRRALYEPSAIPGLCMYIGLALLLLGIYGQASAVVITGAVVVLGGMGLVFAGRLAGSSEQGGAAQAVVESLDGVLRLGTNLVSFARLAAFGLMHVAIGLVVWEAASALWDLSPTAIAAVIVFVIGNAIGFALEALVVGVQAVRLEYYELFSRIFGEEGRPYRPWHVPVVDEPIDAGARSAVGELIKEAL